mmetsp:Transcript_25187/g.65729  ORF Transcript_25187/g.65729 Transcript_25187/m.65729 type:complete len:346 (-) Transcript_25187:34-1071(-)|eukprot:CAMPEP_0182929534 /NCGR_PEP_ID=MMETSP0105_2-20130417/21636_1 /TAXON_ID=81532 ORGANISM="Acanthoeca-like sp., Strain 10tr" /NCGR_SAMPLE_ID=MMETSP0105_2 /ASSEMBLY_ACC=CAM_ASM_000205 /LENGTH=345 /DNA_ID=CAMNT_0025067699 /DNA_START=151 /DNA_END=1185 /DNA_ORIENTATION=-
MDGGRGAAAAAPAAAESEPAAGGDCTGSALVKVTRQGYLLKRSRTGDADSRKPWKKRYFVLHGNTLLYYRHENLAGAFKVMMVLAGPSECTVAVAPTPPWNAEEAHAFVVQSAGVEVALAVLGVSDERVQWMGALEEARGRPAPVLADQSSRYAGSSATFRLRVGFSAALASSAIGRAIVRRYLDADSRSLIAAMLEFAAAERSHKKVKMMEKGAFDIMARMGVIVHAGRMPPALDLSLLYDETVNFTHDFLTHCRDQRLKHVRGPEAEVVPINMGELLRSLGVVTESWRSILEPHGSKKVLATFDDICGAFCRADRINAILLDPEHRGTRDEVERSLQSVMERY